MASTPAQEQFLAITRKSQEAVIAAIKSWVETVKTTTPRLTSVYAPFTDRLPKLPSFGVPFADRQLVVHVVSFRDSVGRDSCCVRQAACLTSQSCLV